MSKPAVERRVLRIFGRVIRPANWIIFSAGIVLMVVAPVVFWLSDEGLLTCAILWVQGIQLSVEGYGQIKDDEDLP